MITNLKTDLRSRRSRPSPIGIGERRPRLSWQYSSDERGDAQAAYIVEILQGGTVFWSSGEVACDASFKIFLAGIRSEFLRTVGDLGGGALFNGLFLA